MPKPDKYKGSYWNAHTSADHQRNDNSDNTRRVRFKQSKFNKKGFQKDWAASVRAHLEDEDVDMAGSAYPVAAHKKSDYHHRRPNRQGSPVPQKLGRRRLFESPSNWYRVTLPFGNKYDKEHILMTIKNNIEPTPLIYFAWSSRGTSATFYVEGHQLAEKISQLDRKIECPDGYKLIVRVISGLPNVDITAELKAKMKTAMEGRFNAETKALNLSRFHADPLLQSEFCVLFKPIILLNVIDIISENIPDLQALNLDDNGIRVLSHLKSMSKKLPNIKILHLANNKINSIMSLEALQGLPLVELVLNGNPLCNKYREQFAYVSEVRKLFPKVLQLDGIALDPPIGFDIEEDIPLPPSQQTFLCNAEGQNIVREFLAQYFNIFDADSRQPLQQAYHENAMLSMTVCYPYGQHVKNSSWLNWYNTDNRNLLRVEDNNRRIKLLKKGQSEIISFLTEMPATKHDMNSFTVDLTCFMPTMLIMTVTGIFKELNSGLKSPPLRHFCRTLVIVPAGSGFCISNELLHISNATQDQAKNSFKLPPIVIQTPASSSAPSSSLAPPQTLNDNIKQQMIQSMAQQSGMNIAWSQKCLEETNWDFNRAAMVFTELHKLGKIPSEAFVQ